MMKVADDEAWFDGNADGLRLYGFDCRCRFFVYAKDAAEAVALAKAGKFHHGYHDAPYPYKAIPYAMPERRDHKG